MRLVDLASSPDNPASASPNTPLHSIAVDDAVCEMLQSHPDMAQDAAALLSHGRSGWKTIHHARQSGHFQPPAGTCNHGAVSLVTGVGSLSFDEQEVRATVLCAPDELILFAIVHVTTYESLLCNSGVQSRCQSSLFVDNRRSGLFYATVQNALHAQNMGDTPMFRDPPFFVSIPNGLAFLRIAEAGRAHTTVNLCPFDVANTGLFRFYDNKPRPRLRFVLQVDAANEYPSRWRWPATQNPEAASLDALLAFLSTRSARSLAEGDATASGSPSGSSSSYWVGAADAAQTATPSHVAMVVAEQFGVVVASSVSRSKRVLRRLKRALEVE